MFRSNLTVIAASSLPFVILAAPFQSGAFSTYAFASLLALLLAGAWFASKPAQLMQRPVVFVWLASVVLTAFMNAAVTGVGMWDIATTVRYTAIAPVTLFLMGYYLTRRHPDASLFALVPGAVVNIIIMLLAFRNPFIGEVKPGMLVGERSRFYLHPVSGEIIYPVTIAESCAAAFALLWFLFAERHLSRWLTYAPLTLTAVALSIAGATRTYLFAIALVFGLMLVRFSLLRRLYRQLMAVMAMLATLGILLISNERLRETVMVRLDRFTHGDFFDNSDRVAIWRERWTHAQSSGLLDGLSMSQYWDTHEVSSHNLLIDYTIIGGWLYALVMVGGLLIMAIHSGFTILNRQVGECAVARAAALLTMIIVAQVSSPIISSLPAYCVLWYLAGMHAASDAASKPLPPAALRQFDYNPSRLPQLSRRNRTIN